ncbi:hypothetical protein, partial [Fulvimarina sp. MAC3]|uniref:hypothetical protein n=1 Tax=Fulvimarina sp. MAC3 TaxID=3148887 RepID=UPI0031FE309D
AARSANTKIKKSSSSQQTNKSPGHKPGLLRVSKPQKEVAGKPQTAKTTAAQPQTSSAIRYRAQKRVVPFACRCDSPPTRRIMPCCD